MTLTELNITKNKGRFITLLDCFKTSVQELEEVRTKHDKPASELN